MSAKDYKKQRDDRDHYINTILHAIGFVTLPTYPEHEDKPGVVAARSLLERLRRAEAGAAALREAASVALEHLEQQGACTEGGPAPVDSFSAATVATLDAALATDAGAAMLEKLRRAEALAGRWEQTEREAQKWSERCEKAEEHIETLRQNSLAFHDKRRAQEARLSRLLRAAQSLHRRWSDQRDAASDAVVAMEGALSLLEEARRERDRLRSQLHDLQFRVDRSHDAVVSERDALRQCAEDRAAQLYCSLNSIISEFRTTTGQWAGRAALVPADPDFARILSRTLKAAQSLHRRWSNQRDKARAEVGQWARCVKELRVERDALRAEVETLKADRDTARRDVETLTQALASISKEKAEDSVKRFKELQAEVERLKAELAAEHDVVVRQLGCMAGQLRQRDAHKAEAERLRAALEPYANGCCGCDEGGCNLCSAARAALAATKGGG